MRKLGESGATEEENAVEGKRIMAMLDLSLIGRMSTWEQNFIESIGDQLGDAEPRLSPNQLFKLRDIKDRYL